ncbi:VOC family protein [Peribacillus butanolivorans]|uniref:VOC family protein n=1 Tax=Peribacillus butanolivorans TaxID=421767 RepID=UPI0030C95F29
MIETECRKVINMLIKKVSLIASDIAEMKKFYVELLNAKLLDESHHGFTIKAGASELAFTETKNGSKPFYHFAFNIPSNQFQEAKQWIKARTSLNTEDGDDEVYFSHLNAHSLYFTDPTGNIVEFIARHSIAPESEVPFSMDSLLNIGEINLTTTKIDAIGQQLIDFGISPRDNGTLNPNGISFMGSNGVFILLSKPGRRWFFSDRAAEIHPLTIEVDPGKTIHQDENGNIRFISSPI